MLAQPQPRRPSTAQDTHYSTHSYFAPPTPPPTTVPRPSISSAAMNWLSHKSNTSIVSLSALRTRSSSITQRESASNSNPNSQPVRISEPYMLRDDIGSFQPRAKASGRLLGHGAEVIGTPAEALDRVLVPSPGQKKQNLPTIPQSPPPSLGLRSSKSSPHLKSPTTSTSSRSPASDYSPMETAALRPVSTKPSILPSHVVPPLTPFSTPPAPSTTPLPLQEQQSRFFIPLPAPQPPFEAVLISNPLLASSFARPSQTVVALETCTETFRTTLSTLTSRPSALADFINSLREPVHNDDGESTRSDTSSAPPSPFSRAFADHLASQGLQSTESSSNRLHIFLDRPSSPYAHILNYLRSPVGAVLPRAVHLGDNVATTTSYEAMKMDALLELRDESMHLGLDELSDLCEAEIKRWYSSQQTQTPRRHAPSPATAHSRPSSSDSTTFRSRDANPTAASKPRGLRHSPSAQGLRPLAVPSSIHETDSSANDASLSTVAPWTELGMRESLSDESFDGHATRHVRTSSAPTSIGPPPNRPLPTAPVPLAPRTAEGLVLRSKERSSRMQSRSRSHSRSVEKITSPTAATTPMARPTLGTIKHVRGNSFLPTLMSPQTPKSTSGANWI